MKQAVFATIFWLVLGSWVGQVSADGHGPVLASDTGDAMTPESAMMMEKPSAEKVSASRVLAKVGEVEITLGHLVAETLQMSQQDLTGTPPDALLSNLLERLIRQESVAQQATQLSVLSQQLVDNRRRQIVADQVIDEIAAGILVTEDQVRTAYDARYGGEDSMPEYNASHILVATEQDAYAVLTAIEGGNDFAAKARKMSIGPSASNGGSLGWLTTTRMVPAFADAVQRLEVGQISAPVQTQFGWHVIRLNDIRIPGVPKFEEAAAGIRQELRREMFNARVQQIFSTAPITRMEVEDLDPTVLVDPSRLTD